MASISFFWSNGSSTWSALFTWSPRWWCKTYVANWISNCWVSIGMLQMKCVIFLFLHNNSSLLSYWICMPQLMECSMTVAFRFLYLPLISFLERTTFSNALSEAVVKILVSYVVFVVWNSSYFFFNVHTSVLVL